MCIQSDNPICFWYATQERVVTIYDYFDVSRVLVCGGRDFKDYEMMRSVLLYFSPKLLIHGAARGADSLAAAIFSDIFPTRPVKSFPANWAMHGRAAGPIRNKQMIDEGLPTLVLAFPGGRGTADMRSRALKAKILLVCLNRA